MKSKFFYIEKCLKSAGATPLSVEQLKTYATTLGDEFTDDVQNEDGTWKYNEGYLILKWKRNCRIYNVKTIPKY